MFPLILLCQGWGLGAENSELCPGPWVCIVQIQPLREARGKMGEMMQEEANRGSGRVSGG